jgi:hypothetical protein
MVDFGREGEISERMYLPMSGFTDSSLLAWSLTINAGFGLASTKIIFGR